MDKRKRHNMLLVLAIIILLAGAAVQVYLMVKSGESSETETAPDTGTQQAQ